MVNGLQESESQERIQKYINTVLIPESKIIFGIQYPGLKPEVSCTMIVEGGLKMYLKKVSPEEIIVRCTLGKLYNLSSNKESFPKRFKISIPKFNQIRNTNIHPEGERAEVTLDDIRIFIIDFIEWVLVTVVKQDIPKELVSLFTFPASKITRPYLKKDKTNEQTVLQKNLRAASNEQLIKKSITEKSGPSTKSKFLLTMRSGKDFSRTYYNDIEINRNELRGIDSNLYTEMTNLSLYIEFSNGGITLSNQSEGTLIYVNDKRLFKNRKKNITTGSFEITINKLKLICSSSKY